MSRYGWRPYVPVAMRQARAWKKMETLRKKGVCIQPVKIEGRKIAQSFWGEAWCDHLEKFSDFENRLPRGRAYVRNGSVCHLEIAQGAISAMVSGSELYNVNITIQQLPSKKWAQVKARCAGQIGSLLELLQGRLSKSVMAVVTDRDNGLFPRPKEISLRCSCPDWAVMCKHVAAVLYGVGARLDESPELLFLLRGVDHEELISAEADVAVVTRAPQGEAHLRIAESDLAHLFGIEMTEAEAGAFPEPAAKRTLSVRKEERPAANASTPKGKRKPAGKVKGSPKAIKTPREKRLEDQPEMGRKEPRSELLLRKDRADSKRAVLGPRKGRPVTGRAVERLREKFKMSKAEFARLLGVSSATVATWEKSEKPLNMRAATRRAWEAIQKLEKKE